MSKLKKMILEQVADLPRQFLRKKLEAKLRNNSIEDEELLESLTDHLLSNGNQPFCWSDGNGGSTHSVSIAFTEEDAYDIMGALDRFLEEGLPSVIQDTVQDSAKSLARQLEKNWPERKLDERNEMQYFRDRIDFRWSKGLDPLRMLLTISREVGQDFADKLARSKAKKGIAKRRAIMMLHMRACQTALEILTLLENGLADGAYARWRTLYEVSVVAFVIERFGDEIAERYFAHDVVSMREAVISEFKHENKEYDPAKLRGELKEIEKQYKLVVEIYGKSFASPYGWAAYHLDAKSPNLRHLERAVDWHALPPNYKWSSHKVHAGVAGAVRGLSSVDGIPLIHSGASNAGLHVPAINTAFSLLQVTSLLFEKKDDLEVTIQMQAMIILRDKVAKECTKAAKKLEKEEREIRSHL